MPLPNNFQKSLPDTCSKPFLSSSRSQTRRATVVLLTNAKDASAQACPRQQQRTPRDLPPDGYGASRAVGRRLECRCATHSARHCKPCMAIHEAFVLDVQSTIITMMSDILMYNKVASRWNGHGRSAEFERMRDDRRTHTLVAVRSGHSCWSASWLLLQSSGADRGIRDTGDPRLWNRHRARAHRCFRRVPYPMRALDTAGFLSCWWRCVRIAKASPETIPTLRSARLYCWTDL